jgi:hypothetical protein
MRHYLSRNLIILLLIFTITSMSTIAQNSVIELLSY